MRRVGIMRGTPWLAGLVCVILVVVPTAVFTGAQEGRDPSSPEAPYAGELHHWAGKSALHFRGACLDERATCVADVTRDDGTFFLPATAQGGSVIVSWRPVDESLRVLRARVAGIEVTGESPLRVDFIGLVAGEHAVRLEPAHRIVGIYDQSADWVATFALNPPLEFVDTLGTSTFQSGAGCVLATCDPLTRVASDPLPVPWNARGSLIVDWDARDGAMRITIPGTTFAAQGDPPLALSLDGIAPGEWRIDARPALAKGPLAEVTVGWHAMLQPTQ